MKGNLKDLALFAAGAIIGSAVAWYVTKTKYEEIISNEIKREAFKERKADINKKIEETNESQGVVEEMRKMVNRSDPDDNEDYIEYGEILELNGYITNPVDEIPSLDEEEVESDYPAPDYPAPYVISPDEFDENNYETQTLMYFNDGYLTDDMDILIPNVKLIIGDIDVESHFGEYEDDSVFVRNDLLKIDYEILADARNYKDLLKAREEFMKQHNQRNN